MMTADMENKIKRRLKVFALATATLTASAQSATISWSKPAEIISVRDLITGDIATTGVNGGYDSDVVVNGVTFEAYTGPEFGQFTKDVASITTKFQHSAGAFTQSRSDVYGRGANNLALDTLLATHLYDTSNKNGTITIQLKSLQIGAKYRIQLIGIADSRPGQQSHYSTPDGGTTRIYRFIDSDNDGTTHAQYSTGSFTADATTQSFTISGSPGFSAILIAEDSSTKSHSTAKTSSPRTKKSPTTSQPAALLGVGKLTLLLRELE